MSEKRKLSDFFATQTKPSKDNSGEKIYVKQEYVSIFEDGKLIKHKKEDFIKKYGSVKAATKYKVIDSGAIIEALGIDKEKVLNWVNPIEDKENLLDDHGHLIVEHDLYNHDDLTNDGIAEAFLEFAKKENLSFVRDDLSKKS